MLFRIFCTCIQEESEEDICYVMHRHSQRTVGSDARPILRLRITLGDLHVL